MNHWLQLQYLRRFEDTALLLIRLLVGSFLIWGVSDNLLSKERMDEFTLFLETQGFIYPWLMARISVWVQFLVGLSFVTGYITRWAGLLCAINFVVALAMVDLATGIRGSFPSAMLVAIGVFLATHGAGRYSADHYSLRQTQVQKVAEE